MSRFLFAAFAFVVLFSVATADVCPKHEVYLECGTACPPTCRHPNPRICTLQCVEGCFCEDGRVRNAQGKCVHLIACICDALLSW